MASQKIYMSTTNPQGSFAASADTVKAGEQSNACGCEDLVQPKFFYGQLLTDQDLNVLKAWGENKFKLGRFKTGSGVACGLQVFCDSAKPSGVQVAPGYAVDSCGNDIVLCGQTSLDLAEAAPPLTTTTVTCAASPGSATPSAKGEGADTANDFVLVDIFIRYATEDTDPRPTLNAAGGQDSTMFSRMREKGIIGWRPAQVGSNPCQEGLLAWEKAYFDGSRKVVEEYLTQFAPGRNDSLAVKKAWLEDWVKRNPLRQFGFVLQDIQSLGAEHHEAQIAAILFWCVLDYRIAYLSLCCPSGTKDGGVTLARVTLKRPKTKDESCRVIDVDNIPPFRQPLTPGLWPAPLGHFNLGQLVWHREEEVAARLRDLGMEVVRREAHFPDCPAELCHLLKLEQERCTLFADLGCAGMLHRFRTCVVYTYKPPCPPDDAARQGHYLPPGNRALTFHLLSYFEHPRGGHHEVHREHHEHHEHHGGHHGEHHGHPLHDPLAALIQRLCPPHLLHGPKHDQDDRHGPGHHEGRDEPSDDTK